MTTDHNHIFVDPEIETYHKEGNVVTTARKPHRLLGAVGCFAVLTLILSAAAGAQTGVLFVNNNRVGIGISTPTTDLHVVGAAGTTKVLVVDTGGGGYLAPFEMRNDGPLGFRLLDTAGSASCGSNCIDFNNAGGEFRLNFNDGDGPELRLTVNGQLILPGATLPDYVFEPDYPLLPLDELEAFIERNKHLPNLPSQAEVDEAGYINVSELQLRLLEKVEELTLYTLEQQKQLAELSAEMSALRERLEDLRAD